MGNTYAFLMIAIARLLKLHNSTNGKEYTQAINDATEALQRLAKFH